MGLRLRLSLRPKRLRARLLGAIPVWRESRSGRSGGSLDHRWRVGPERSDLLCFHDASIPSRVERTAETVRRHRVARLDDAEIKMRNLEGASPADRTPVIAWLMAGGSVIMAWQALSTFKSGSAEWTLAPPLVAPGLIFAAAAVEVRRRFGRWGLAGSWAVGVATSMAVAGPSLLEAMDIGSSPGFQWVPMMVFGVPF